MEYLSHSEEETEALGARLAGEPALLDAVKAEFSSGTA